MIHTMNHSLCYAQEDSHHRPEQAVGGKLPRTNLTAEID